MRSTLIFSAPKELADALDLIAWREKRSRSDILRRFVAVGIVSESGGDIDALTRMRRVLPPVLAARSGQ